MHFRLALVVYKSFDKNIYNTNKGAEINSDIVSENKELSKELHKPNVRTFKNEKHIHLL